MQSTCFRPSIHGWPFVNSFQYTAPFLELTVTMGFCGGMCWAALKRFYSATQIQRTTTQPTQGTALYMELLTEQVSSLSPSRIAQILAWQASPKLKHAANPLTPLGERTQKEWETVQQHIDGGHPVTLTLIAHSNDLNPMHLKDNHRVVAYAYSCSQRHSRIRFVTLYIYDPNFPNRDDVALTFFTGCDDSSIRLTHNQGTSAHGFFVDTVTRRAFEVASL